MVGEDFRGDTLIPYHLEQFRDLLPLNRWITYCAFALAASQFILIFNFFYSMFAGKRADGNIWQANTLDWQTASPPPQGNFAEAITVHRGPYEYSQFDNDVDYWPQSEAAFESFAENVNNQSSAIVSSSEPPTSGSDDQGAKHDET